MKTAIGLRFRSMRLHHCTTGNKMCFQQHTRRFCAAAECNPHPCTRISPLSASDFAQIVNFLTVFSHKTVLRDADNLYFLQMGIENVMSNSTSGNVSDDRFRCKHRSCLKLIDYIAQLAYNNIVLNAQRIINQTPYEQEVIFHGKRNQAQNRC